MALYAHARIEDPNTPGRFFERGDEVPEDIAEGLESVSTEPYDPESDKNAPPDVIEVDGVRYTKESAAEPAEPAEEAPDA